MKKIEGNIAQLREDLKVALGIEEDREIQVNHLTRHIIVKVCCSTAGFLVLWRKGRGGRGWFEGLGAWLTFVNRDTANQKLPSFWRSISFKRRAWRGTRERGSEWRSERRKNCITKMECIL